MTYIYIIWMTDIEEGDKWVESVYHYKSNAESAIRGLKEADKEDGMVGYWDYEIEDFILEDMQ